MPYSNNQELPEQVANLPQGAKSIWRKSFNSAFHSTCNGDEGCAARIAWSAVKKSYVKREDKWKKIKQSKDMQTIVAHFEWQFKGSIPDVPFNDGVDVVALTADDEDPMYVTLPFAKDGGIAHEDFRGKMRYTPQFNAGLVAQIKANGITAKMGHVNPMFGAYDFPIPDAIWVGAMSDGVSGLHWGKAYVRNPEVKTLLKQLKAAGAFMTTSIYGGYDSGKMIQHADGTYEVPPEAFNLYYLDFASQKSAALSFPEREMMSLTAHQADEQIEPNEEDTMDEKQFEILQQQLSDANNTLAQAITDRDAARTELAQMTATLSEVVAELRSTRLVQLVHSKVAVDSDELREYVLTKAGLSITAQMTPDEMAAEIDKVLDTEIYKNLAQAIVLQKSGGTAITGKGSDANDKTLGQQLSEPDKLAEIASKYGVNKQ